MITEANLQNRFKRELIRGLSTHKSIFELLTSEECRGFLRSLQRVNQSSYIEDIKKSISGDKDTGKVDFSKPLREAENLDSQVLGSQKSALETFSLILISIAGLKSDEIENPKIELIKNLVFDLLQTSIYQIDPWFIEKTIIEYHKSGMLRARMGATGETLYQLTEEFVVSNWSLFSDEFRHLYRHELYEE